MSFVFFFPFLLTLLKLLLFLCFPLFPADLPAFGFTYPAISDGTAGRLHSVSVGAKPRSTGPRAPYRLWHALRRTLRFFLCR